MFYKKQQKGWMKTGVAAHERVRAGFKDSESYGDILIPSPPPRTPLAGAAYSAAGGGVVFFSGSRSGSTSPVFLRYRTFLPSSILQQ